MSDYNQGMTDQEIPEGFKELKIPQPHIENLGPGFYKKEDDQLLMIFFVKKEHSNFYETSFDYTLSMGTVVLKTNGTNPIFYTKDQFS